MVARALQAADASEFLHFHEVLEIAGAGDAEVFFHTEFSFEVLRSLANHAGNHLVLAFVELTAKPVIKTSSSR